ncbi:MAG: alpha/beta hydrolase [Flavobacteriaceae bacterium]|nr:alpha/beta hydrolase [Flavobacteriaceae bacterium]
MEPIHIDITSVTSFDEINQLIDNSVDENSIIVGFSLGGFSAMNFAIQHPSKVKKLLIISGHMIPLEKPIELTHILNLL